MPVAVREIFRAIHQGKWLYIEYSNKQGDITKYWIGIKDLNPFSRRLKVSGLHLVSHTLQDLNISLDSILSARIIDGSYAPVNQTLIDNIRAHPEQYESLFGKAANPNALNLVEWAQFFENGITMLRAATRDLSVESVQSNRTAIDRKWEELLSSPSSD